MMKLVLRSVLLSCAFFCTQSLYAQNTQWESMYSYYKTNAGAVIDQNIIVAAENALFVYDTDRDSSETITTVDGLSGDNFSALAGYKNYIIAGHENGLLTQINLDTKKINLDNAIERNETIAADLKIINHIYVSNDVVYLATGFGIVVVNPTTLEFGDTYYFGTVKDRIAVYQAMVFEDKLYAATAQGLFSTSLNNPQILMTSTWTQVAIGTWKALWEQNGALIAAKEQGSEISFFQIDNAPQYKAKFSGVSKSIMPYDEGVIITTSNRIYDVNESFQPKQTITTIDGVKSNTFLFALQAGNEKWIGTSSNGLIRYSKTGDEKFVSPEGPLNNSIWDIETLTDELWISHGDYEIFYNPWPLEKYGISRFYNEQWSNISNKSLFDIETFVRVVAHPSTLGTLYACSYHRGIVLIEENTPVELWNQTNSGLESLTFDGPNVSIRVRDALVDDSGNLWSLTSFVQKGLKKRSSSGQWTSYDLSEVVLDYTKESGYSNMELFNDKILFFGGIKSGLIGVDILESPPKMKRLLGGDLGLPSDDIRSIRLDKDNRLWVGTKDGIAVLYAPNRFFEDDVQLRPIIIDDSGNLRELLAGQFITDIEVDGNNQKWVSTASSGVFLLSPNGTEILQHFTKENSPLPTSSVKTIGVDNSTGKVYLGTLNGLVVYQGDAYKEEEKLSEVNVFPNPVRPHFTGNLVVRGLQQDTRVKITDIAGNLVYDTTSEGGSISWNLQSFSGQRVRSGVYLIFVTSKEGLDSAVKKVMIIN
ncbi:MAG: T9SS type A sorting domain-containing protein [Flavobacteriaceae bacterium]